MPQVTAIPRVATWLAAAHLVLAGGVLAWAFHFFSSAPIGEAPALPAGLRWGMAVQEVADWPANWLTMALDRLVPLPTPMALAAPVLAGTLQWFLVGLLLAPLLRRLVARRQAR